MLHYQKYLQKGEILKRTEHYGFPQPHLLELLVYDYEIFRQLLSLSRRFVLKGGAAAQLFFPVEQQRASIDIDLITSHTPGEVEDLFLNKLGKLDFASVKVHVPKKPKKSLPLVTYLVDLPSVTRESCQVKIDILFEELSSYRVEAIRERELFALKVTGGFPCVTRGSLVADKLLTLASRSIGIAKAREDQLPKHLYDLFRLMKVMKPKDFDDVLFSFPRIARSEMGFRKIEHELKDVIGHVDEFLSEVTRADYRDERMKKLIQDFQSAYVNREARGSLQDWVIGALRLRYLLKAIRKVLIEKKDKKASFEKFIECERELQRIGGRGIDDKRVLRDKLLEEAKKKIPYWKSIKGTSEIRIYLELKQLE